HLRRVAAEVALDDLEHAPRVLQGGIAALRSHLEGTDERIPSHTRYAAATHPFGGALHRAALSACRLLAGLLRRGRRAPFHVLPGIAAWAIVLPGGVLVLPNEGVVRPVLDAAGVL